MTSSRLLALPTEILANIASNLDVEDYGDLRLSCKHLEDRLFPFFGKIFFESKHFYRNFYSLSTLMSISRSRYRPFVKAIILGTELLPSDVHMTPLTASPNACHMVFADQTSLLASAWDRDFLILSLMELKNLETVAVQDFESGRWCTMNDGPLDDGYGMQSLMDELGVTMNGWMRQKEFKNQSAVCVQMLLTVLGMAGARPKSFKMLTRTRAGGISCAALHIPYWMELSVLPFLSALEELHLDVREESRSGRTISKEPLECDTVPLRRFLGFPTQLRCLWLSRLKPYEPKEGFWSWLGAPPLATGLMSHGIQPPADHTFPIVLTPPPLALTHLRELGFGDTEIPISSLLSLLQKVASTLTKLSLHKVTLGDGKLCGNGEPNVNFWADLFERLAGICGKLYEVDIKGGFKQQSVNGGRVMALRREGQPIRTEFSYKGHDIAKVLEDLVMEVRIPASHES